MMLVMVTVTAMAVTSVGATVSIAAIVTIVGQRQRFLKTKTLRYYINDYNNKIFNML